MLPTPPRAPTAAVETDAFDHLHEVVRRELDAVQVGNLFRAILQEVDHRQVDARHRGNVVGVEGQRCACSGDGFVEGHQFFDRAGFEVERGDGAYGIYPPPVRRHGRPVRCSRPDRCRPRGR